MCSDFYIGNGFVGPDFYIIRYLMSVHSCIFESVVGGNCCIIIYCMGGHAGVIDGFAGLNF